MRALLLKKERSRLVLVELHGSCRPPDFFEKLGFLLFAKRARGVDHLVFTSQ